MSGTDEGNLLCMMYGCLEMRKQGSWYCQEHTVTHTKKPEPQGPVWNITKNITHPEKQVIISDHIKINIEQTAKGARCTVTYDRSDHDMAKAISAAVDGYIATIAELKEQGAKVDES